VLFAVLALFTVPRQVRRIQADVRARAEQALAAVASGVHIEVSGRDVVLSGDIADAAARRELSETVAGVWGVRRVVDHTRLAVAASALPSSVTREAGTRRIGALPQSPPAAADAYASSMRVSALFGARGTLTLSGQAPNQSARDAIAARARKIFGDDRVRDRLRAAKGDEKAGWREAVFEGLVVLRRLERGRMDATAYRIRVGGLAVDAAIESEIASALRSVAPSDVQVAVDVDSPPRRDADAADGGAER